MTTEFTPPGPIELRLLSRVVEIIESANERLMDLDEDGTSATRERLNDAVELLHLAVPALRNQEDQ